ncbi:hypothetical protein [Corynebacterium argentoratense]|uniref:hypothetical protein n=1 Tax=Corynebacterium argentoratense TaxID=42817 RepID=UPI001F1F0FD9|nr:hypothetical protein [Corynebacterium argentoratense]MCF1694291.1 hypothetical protein [Corynebacterium argentoratense]MCF1735862.1 hypothetical protein [Corynebacterium argentoratense]
MNEIIANPGKDFGNLQLSYTITESTNFPSLEFIDESYVASLLFKAPGTSVSIVLTADQLRYWFECLELSTANGGVNMQTLPIICPKREDEHLDVITVGNELSFAGGTMVISINIADCLKEFANCVSSIWRELEEKEEGLL